MRRSRAVAAAARVAPSWRSVALGLAVAVGAAAAYVLARETSLFATRMIEVEGAPPPVLRDVRAALAPLRGKSLLVIGSDEIDRRLATLPTVAAASYDRAFPHTLRVHVRPERPLAVIREGADGWLVSDHGRAMRKLRRPARSSLPRIWLPRTVSVDVGGTIADDAGRRALKALAALGSDSLAARIRDVRTSDAELTLMLRSGLEVRLGDASNLRLKLALADRILPQLTTPGYLDVAVPARPVAGTNTQVAGRG